MGFVIESQGNCLIMNINGDRLTFYPTGSGDIWANATAGQLKIEQLGTMLVVNTTQARLIAYPTHTNTWIVNGSFDPGPDPEPGTGDFSWPYEPTPGHWVTSEFGPRSGRFHEGIDFSGGPALTGLPIPSIGDGTVESKFFSSGFGNCLIVDHGIVVPGEQWYSLYAHQNVPSPKNVGDSVTKAETIGYVGNTGNSFGAHLHMETHRTAPGAPIVWDNLNPSYTSNRTAINPRRFFNSFGDGTWILS